MCCLALASGALAQPALGGDRDACEDRHPLRRAFFGDTHVHTGYSFDAWGQGTLARPDDAYRFAKGERIGSQPYDDSGKPLGSVQLRRPLDFAVVTDHSDLLGETQICQDPSLSGYDSLVCQVVRRFPALGYALINGHTYSSEQPSRYSFCGENGEHCLAVARHPWEDTQAAAEAHYDRSASCGFTSFVGYEWTGMPGGNNIHRNVIFESEVAQDFPTTYIETPTAEGLWRSLMDECIEGKPGCDVLVIPHNSNVSNGLMWTTTRADGSAITVEDARLRARLETLVEVTQHKGDSECRAGAEDELCSYETLPFRRMQDMVRALGDQKIPPLVYAREALSEGLAQHARLGVNPFQFGLIGSTDTHFGTPGMVDEDQYIGHAAGTVNARFGVPPFPDLPVFNPGGLAVLYAEENSRPALFAAMQRREAYGTSGPRIRVRFFGGFGLEPELCQARDRVARGYAQGVPMGGEFGPSSAAATDAPAFLVAALKDPGGQGVPTTPLERIQIVKGWTADGRVHEKVFDIAGEPGSSADVDLDTCTPNPGGQDQMCAVWRDPDFDPAAHAFYYARVVERHSCRWNAWVCMRAAVDCESGSVPSELAACCGEEVPNTIQERAWTSPIWYTPSKPGDSRRAAPKPERSTH
jgi:hypothetical protein